MLLPGPEAQQLAIYTGWLLNGTRGGLIAGTLFVLPGVLTLLALSALYVAFGSTAAVTGVFAGLAPAVVAIVAQAVFRVGKRCLTHPLLIALGAASFAALALFAVPFPAVIAAALAGWLIGRYKPDAFTPASVHGGDGGPPPRGVARFPRRPVRSPLSCHGGWRGKPRRRSSRSASMPTPGPTRKPSAWSSRSTS